MNAVGKKKGGGKKRKRAVLSAFSLHEVEPDHVEGELVAS